MGAEAAGSRRGPGLLRSTAEPQLGPVPPGPSLPSCPSAKAENGELAALHPEGGRVTQSPSLTNCLSPGLQAQQPHHPGGPPPQGGAWPSMGVCGLVHTQHSRYPPSAQAPGPGLPGGSQCYCSLGPTQPVMTLGISGVNGPQRHPGPLGSRKPHTSVAVP